MKFHLNFMNFNVHVMNFRFMKFHSVGCIPICQTGWV